ncbi:unnamed protein product [Lactuca saligna]|uniref:Uncharacterized protein n=1 Tax=Lactuca saligna TaxID=75948 RepID=A0AA36A4C5_LACSI|nr:unnamed protein product [Lactuca saligna]
MRRSSGAVVGSVNTNEKQGVNGEEIPTTTAAINPKITNSTQLNKKQKAGEEISSVLPVGKSIHGRSLFPCKPIHAGDCILKVPYTVQLAPDNLLPSVSSLLGDDVTNVAKLALVILMHQKLGQASEWAPYINCLPPVAEIHSTKFSFFTLLIVWNDEELKMIGKVKKH